MKRDIKLKWYYPYPVEVVWDCLTNPEKLKEWSSLNKTSDFKPEVGFRWMEEQKPRKGWDGKMYFQVLEVIPFKKLSYSFKGGPNPQEMTLDTVVTWILEPKEDGTEVHLHHTGFTGMKNVMTSFIMEFGWKKILGKRLLPYLNTLKK